MFTKRVKERQTAKLIHLRGMSCKSCTYMRGIHAGIYIGRPTCYVHDVGKYLVKWCFGVGDLKRGGRTFSSIPLLEGVGLTREGK